MGHRSWVRGRRARFSGPVRQARIRRSGQRLEVSSRRSWARIRRSAPGSFLYMRVAAFFQRIPICQLKAVFRFRRFLLSQRMQRLGQVSAVRSGQRSGGHGPGVGGQESQVMGQMLAVRRSAAQPAFPISSHTIPPAPCVSERKRPSPPTRTRKNEKKRAGREGEGRVMGWG